MPPALCALFGSGTRAVARKHDAVRLQGDSCCMVAVVPPLRLLRGGDMAAFLPLRCTSAAVYICAVARQHNAVRLQGDGCCAAAAAAPALHCSSTEANEPRCPSTRRLLRSGDMAAPFATPLLRSGIRAAVPLRRHEAVRAHGDGYAVSRSVVARACACCACLRVLRVLRVLRALS